nr:PAS domain-containing protein [Panacagrimonas sp.]
MSGALLQAWHAGGDSLATIAGPMSEPVTCVDLDGRFVYANDAALRALDLFGGPPVSGYRLTELCPNADGHRAESHDRDVMSRGEASVREERFVAAGYAHHWHVTRLPLRDPDGTVCGLLSLWVERRARVGTEPADSVGRADGAPAEDELRANAERFRHLVETLGDVYWILDWRRMRRLYISPACERLWDLPARGFYAGSGYWIEHVYREDREQVEAALADLAQGHDFVCEYRIVRGNGSLGWVRDRAVPVFGEDGAVDRVIGVCEDISEQRDLVSGIVEQERQLRTLNDTLPIGIARCTRERRYHFANRAYARNLLDVDAESVPGRSIAELIGDAAMQTLEPSYARVLQGEPVTVACAIPFKSAGVRQIRARLVPERDAGGAVSGWIEVVEDVTERAKVERLLYQRDREFKTLVENAPDVIARLDRELRYRYINAAVEAALGIKAVDFIGRRGAELDLPTAMHETVEAGVRQAFDQAREHTASFHLDGRNDERRRHFQARFVPEFARGESHTVESVLMIVYDVTARQRAQHERERLLAGERSARERAEAASRARDQFLSIVSHELRSPLNAIQSWTSVLETQVRDQAPPVMRRALTGIRSGVDQQVRLIEDLLDATRILSGRLGLAVSLVRLAPVIESAIARVQETATARGVTFDVQLEREHDGVQGDPQRLQQIAWNLLTNAIKFSPTGATVGVTLEREGSTVRLRVRDQGKGFDAAFLPHLFDWFQREDTSSQRRQEGLGLGLALVRHLTEMQGGTVSASNAGPGHGACFEVRLPLAADASAVRDVRAVEDTGARDGRAAPLPSLSGVQVMLVDDKAEAREALGALLTGMDATVSTFASGSDALQWLRARGADHGVDVLLCDLAMPVQDGFATLLRLRALEDELGVADGRRLPVIAVTAFAQHEDRQRALDAGFALHVAKPVSPEELAGAIAGELTQRAAARASIR